jgi:hypothetical protein
LVIYENNEACVDFFPFPQGQKIQTARKKKIPKKSSPHPKWKKQKIAFPKQGNFLCVCLSLLKISECALPY